jgi:hypothetical protein
MMRGPAPVRVPDKIRRDLRLDLLVALTAVGLVVASSIVGWMLLDEGVNLFLRFPPLLAVWLPHVGPGTPFAIVIAVAVVTRGPGLATRLAWRRLRPFRLATLPSPSGSSRPAGCSPAHRPVAGWSGRPCWPCWSTISS